MLFDSTSEVALVHVKKIGRNRLGLAGLAVVAVVVVIIAGSGQGATAEPGTTSSPGTDPAIQQWFADIEQPKVDFNNALHDAEPDIAAGQGTAKCSALAQAADRMNQGLLELSVIPNGGAEIAAAYGPPFNQFATAAAACVQGDYPTARTQLGDTTSGAIAAYGAAQNTVDELLDGGA